MTDQLVLIDVEDLDSTHPAWQLDPATIEIGRRGVARAREALQTARASDRPGTIPRSGLPAAA